ncbi:glucose dehydrogenase [FAD, quinone]-like [Varroa destructor]|uniref:Glucose-methanol-choline oxidoreductase N-terminal domain-containing protein n=1 Tax=Varroa destructor TaxID=109461 RepID=A0A7M7MBU0_VARDE|nr:glucose dehydrogenase [FAD, quinone]-like [Varroa destructor]
MSSVFYTVIDHVVYPINHALFYAFNGITELFYHAGLGGMGRYYIPFIHMAFLSVFVTRPEIRDYNTKRIPIETNHKLLRASYDFIIVGGGMAGCLAANRLSRHYTVLLIHGPGALPNILTRVPLLNALNQAEPSHDFRYVAEPSDINLQWKTHAITYNSGKTLGGSAILSAHVYSMGRKADFDEWIQVYGATGFDYDTLGKYAKRHTKAQGTVTGLPLYGTSGELHVDHADTPNYYMKYKQSFLKAAAYVTGTQIVRDHNEELLGFGSATHAVEKHTGFISTPVRAFLEPIAYDEDRRNRLHIILESMVERVGIIKRHDGKLAARGVIVKMKNRARRYFFAHKKVILAAGAVRTPQILMLSGIGPLDELTKWNLPLLLHREGVGRNLHDHYDLGTALVVFPKGKGFVDVAFSDLVQFFLTGTGAIKNPYAVNALGFFRSKNTSYSTCITQETCQPDFEILVHTCAPNHPAGGSTLRAAYITTSDLNKYFINQNGGSLLTPKEAILFTPTILHPVTRGRIKLRDFDIDSNPRIFLNVLSNERDLQMAAELYLTARKIGILAYAKLGGKWMDVRQEGCHGPEDSFRYARCAVQHFLKTAWHLGGTARIGQPHDPFAVVDTHLNVIGVDNLAVIDASVIPAPVSGHMLATIASIAEKFCDEVHRGIA